MKVLSEADRLFTDLDVARIRKVVESMVPELLSEHLDSFEAVPSQRIPGDIVTMNSRVAIRDHQTGCETSFTLGYPGRTAIARGFVSVLSPLGSSLLGLRAGNDFSWRTPDGSQRSATLVSILYQPEANGDFTS
ncbi:MAG: transcription elongation factor GreAB [Proteobacteria bacterium]|nr:MAG: transcription elongation factor GreAB [Pseudomonadota bacterium]